MRAVSTVTLPEGMLDQWKRWERGRNRPDEFYRPLIAATFDKAVESIFGSRGLSPVHHMPIQARRQPGPASLDSKEDHVKRRTALGIGLASALSPATVADVLRESAAEAFEYTQERSATEVGSGTLEQLTAAIDELDSAYGWQPATELFPLARGYRQHVESLIDGKRTLTELRELYVHGAYLSHILADLALDLGSRLTAKAFAIDSYQLASDAGHNELCAWAADTHACAMRFTRSPGETVSVALKGLSRVPRQHPLAARLWGRAAQGHAGQGNQAACVEALAKARAVCDGLPDEMPSRFSTDRAEHVSYSIATYAAECLVELRAWKEAEQQARTAAGVHQWSPRRAAHARLDLSIALANLGSVDEAAEHGKHALAFGRDRGMGGLLVKAHKLDTVLSGRYPKEPGAIEFHEQYKAITSPTPLTP
jgi:hypothetical protein